CRASLCLRSNTVAHQADPRSKTAPRRECLPITYFSQQCGGDVAISRPIVLTSPMDGTPQVVRFDATTLWHLDAAEWAPSTASIAAEMVGRMRRSHVRFAPESGHGSMMMLCLLMTQSGHRQA